MTTTVEEAVRRLVQRAADGTADLLRLRAAPPEVLDLLGQEASLGTVTLVEVRPDAGAFAFAQDPVVRALAEHDAGLDVPPVSAGAPARLLDWVTSSVEASLARLAARTPVVVTVNGAERLDRATRRWLPALRVDGVGVVVVDSGTVRPGDTAREPSDPAEALVLQLLALSPLALTTDELARVSGLESADAAVVVERLAAAEVVGLSHGYVALGDGDLRARAASAVAAPLRFGVLREIGAALRARGVPHVPLAELALETSTVGEVDAVHTLIEAMDELSTSDPAAAADYGAAAVRLVRGPGELLTTTAWRLLPLLWRTARVEEARALAHRVFTEQGQAEAEAQVLLWLSRFEPTPARAARLTAAALAIPDVSTPVRARLFSVHLRCLSTQGLADEVDALLPEALAEAVEAGDDESLSRLITCDAIRHFYRGDYTTAATLTARAEETWQRAGARPEQWLPEMVWAPHLTSVLGDPDAALDLLDARLASLHGGSDALLGPLIHAERSQVQLVAGRLDEASDEVVAAAYAVERLWGAAPGIDDRLQAIGLAVRVKVALHRGDMAELADLRRALDEMTPRPGSEAQLRRDWWCFLIDDADLPATASNAVDVAALQPVSWLDPADEVVVVRALLMRGHPQVARAWAARAAARAAGPGAHLLATTLHHHVIGLVDWDREPLAAAVQGWRDLKRPLLEAAARSDLGVKLLELGDPEGLELLEHAHRRLTELGALRDAWRVRWALRAKGHLLSPERDRTRDLTPTERRVVERALTGSTVNQIAEELDLSRHTVSTHLRHVYAKLDISSRSELLAWAQQT